MKLWCDKTGSRPSAYGVRAVPFELLRARRGSANNVPAVKAAMDELGLGGGSVLPPLSALPDDETPDLREALAVLSTAVRATVRAS